MKKKDKISIIIPVYNGEKYITDCINSLISQTYQNIEIIIVNDGSVDKSKEICEKFEKKDKRVKLYNQINSGVSAARNLGIKRSNGKYVTFVDSDDTVSLDYVEYLYNLINDNCADISLTRNPSKFKLEVKSEKLINFNDYVEVLTGEEAVNEMLLYKIVISSWNKMFKKQLLLDNNILFNTNLSFGEGFEFVINAFLKSLKVIIGQKKVYNYRVDNTNSVMTKFSRKLVTGSIDSQESIKNIINASLINLKDCTKISNSFDYSFWHTNCDCLNTILGSNSKKQNIDLYLLTKNNCKLYALKSFKCNIPKKDKIKSIMYFISPTLAAKVINKFRLRKYTKN